MSYGLDPKHFVIHVIRPALTRMQLWSPAAEVLVLGTALVESELRWLLQRPNGPAMGPFQMEPATHFDCWQNWLRFPQNVEIRTSVMRMATHYSGDLPDPGEMKFNHLYAAAMCRVKYVRAKPAIPPVKDAAAMAAYHKTFYNSPKGATKVEESIRHFEFAIHLEV